MAASHKVLVSDSLSENGLSLLKSNPLIALDYQPGLGKDAAKLKTAIADAEALIIRSGTTVTPEIFSAAKALKVVGRAGIGVDNVDLVEASRRGVIVMNTPSGNTVTTAEHAIALLCALVRAIPQATASMRAGKWEKNKFMGAELTHKTLGVIGAGNIGKIVISRAQGLRMKVIAYDPFLTDEMAAKLEIERVDLDALFSRADAITIHTPLTDKTRNLLNREAFQKMKKGVFIVNAARGGIVSETDLLAALEEGKVAGAALDVFEKEPPAADHPLLKSDKVIFTPHLGAATTEAQENVAVEVAEQISAFFTDGTIQNAVNFPSLTGKLREVLAPFQRLSERLGSLAGQLVQEAPSEIRIEYRGEITAYSLASLTSSLLYGLLSPMSEPGVVNPVNAISLAKERGITLTESKVREAGDFTNLISLNLLSGGKAVLRLSGTVFGKAAIKLVSIDDLPLDAPLQGNILLVRNQDKPGVIGKVGSILGEAGVNIAWMQLGCLKAGGEAVSLYGVEPAIAEASAKALKAVPGIVSVQKVAFPQ